MYTGHTDQRFDGNGGTGRTEGWKSNAWPMIEELHAIFSMQIPIADGDQIFMGAA